MSIAASPIAATPIAVSEETAELVRVSAASTAGGISYTVNRVELGGDLLWDDGSEIVWDDETNIGGEV
jgi:hypothetical protein